MNDQATASDSLFVQGRNARPSGKTAEECPYPEGSQEREAGLPAFREAAADEPGEGLPMRAAP